MTLPILYSFRRCPYAIRARLAILVSGLVCELREVSLANKPEAMLLASPKTTIPVMVLPDGRVLEESLDIMSYVLRCNDPKNWLGPVNDTRMAWVRTNDDVFKVHLDHYKYPGKYSGDAHAHRDAGLSILARLDHVLAQQKFLAGPTCSLIDIAILPFVRQFAAVDEAWFGTQPIPFVQAWLVQFLASDMFAAAMVSLPIWKPGDGATLFPLAS